MAAGPRSRVAPDGWRCTARTRKRTGRSMAGRSTSKGTSRPERRRRTVDDHRQLPDAATWSPHVHGEASGSAMMSQPASLDTHAYLFNKSTGAALLALPDARDAVRRFPDTWS